MLINVDKLFQLVIIIKTIIFTMNGERNMKKGINESVMQKFYNFFSFIFWGFYFSAGYLFCKKLNINNFLMSV